MLIGIQVFLERKKRRQLVGVLTQEGDEFVFKYDRSYLKAWDVISLGPEMPLTRAMYRSKKLFVPFSDRIPSKDNPAYKEYCAAVGISPVETNPFILLSTIAHRGPSSFIFEPLVHEEFSHLQLLEFRKSLKLTVREFAACFDFSPAAITRVEKGQSSGQEILKRVELYVQFPEVAMFQLRRRSGVLHTQKLKFIAVRLGGMSKLAGLKKSD